MLKGWQEMKEATEYENWERARMIASYSCFGEPKGLKTGEWKNPRAKKQPKKAKKAISGADLRQKIKERDSRNLTKVREI